MRLGIPRPRRVPPDVTPHLALRPGERPLAVAALDDGSTAVATSSRLLVAREAGLRWSVAWHEVDAATWDPDGPALVVQLVNREVATLVVAERERTLLPEVVRERVQSSVVLTRRVDASGSSGVRVVVRRGPDGLLVQVLADPGVDVADPAVAAEVDRARRDVARAAGLDGPKAPEWP